MLIDQRLDQRRRPLNSCNQCQISIFSNYYTEKVRQFHLKRKKNHQSLILNMIRHTQCAFLQNQDQTTCLCRTSLRRQEDPPTIGHPSTQIQRLPSLFRPRSSILLTTMDENRMEDTH